MGGAEAAGAAPKRIAGRASVARVLSVNAGADAADRPEERRRRQGPLITLVVVVLLGAGYHLWNAYTAPPPPVPATYEGAPSGTMAVQSGNTYSLIAMPGKTVNAAELESFKRREALKGNQVREVAPGTWVIEPASAGPGGAP
jgi:hypothetical protein